MSWLKSLRWCIIFWRICENHQFWRVWCDLSRDCHLSHMFHEICSKRTRFFWNILTIRGEDPISSQSHTLRKFNWHCYGPRGSTGHQNVQRLSSLDFSSLQIEVFAVEPHRSTTAWRSFSYRDLRERRRGQVNSSRRPSKYHRFEMLSSLFAKLPWWHLIFYVNNLKGKTKLWTITYLRCCHSSVCMKRTSSHPKSCSCHRLGHLCPVCDVKETLKRLFRKVIIWICEEQ